MEDLSDITFILFAITFSYFLEYSKYSFDLSVLNIFIFINIMGIYYISKKIRVSITIEYNRQRN